MHHPIEQIVYAMRPDSVFDEAGIWRYLLAVGLPIILVGCAAFWYCFERPFMGRISKKAKKGKLAEVVSMAVVEPEALKRREAIGSN